MRIIISIDGQSANNLIPIGTKDLLHHVLPEKLKINSKDVVSIRFVDDENGFKRIEHYRRN